MSERCRIVLEEGGRRLEAEGPRDFVEAQIARFHGDAPAPAAGPRQARPARLSLAAFLESKGAVSASDRALVAGYYLEKYERTPSWAPEALEAALAGAGGPEGAALDAALAEAGLAGRLEALPDGRLTLTYRGSAYVQSGLTEV